MDADYVPPDIETRQVYGISLQQRRNDCKIDETLFQNIVTSNKDVSAALYALSLGYHADPFPTSS
jgi:AICAR transformylase/IMP cyclohydrolase PurH